MDGDNKKERRVIFDLHCIGVDGEVIIIEMQQLFQEFFMDRAVYYTSRLISKQLKRGEQSNTYCLPKVYFIGILEFALPMKKRLQVDPPTSESYFYDIALCDKLTQTEFYEKLGYKMISLPLFNKKPAELKTNMDRWLYLLKHLSTMDKLPSFLDKRIFGRIFDIGEIGKLKPEDLMSYEASIKRKMDNASVDRTTRAEGERKKALEIALKLKKMGFSAEDIVKITDLTIEEVEKL